MWNARQAILSFDLRNILQNPIYQRWPGASKDSVVVNNLT